MTHSSILLHRTIMLLGLIFLFFWWSAAPVQAQVLPEDMALEGHAWSSHLGWISLSCKNGGPTGGNICGTPNDYQVTMRADGSIDGYAWTPHYGWLQFGGLSGFPTGGGTTAVNARVVEDPPASGQYRMEGWARFCAAAANPATCSGGASASAGGWDGWIALRGTGYGVRFDLTTGFTDPSFAFGSPVASWIAFHVGGALPPSVGALALTPTGHYLIKDGDPAVPTFDNVSFTAAINNGPATGTRAFTLELEDAGGTVLDSVSGVYDFATNSFTPPLRLDGIDAHLPSQPHIVTLNLDGSSMSVPITLVVPEPLIVSFAPTQSLVRKNDTSTIRLEIDSNQTYNITCTITGPGISASYNYVVDTSPTVWTEVTSPIQSEARYQLECANPYVVPVTIPLAQTAVRVIPTFQES